jgi:hypothetical protein
VVSLDQVTGKLEQILTQQEAELDVLSSQSEHVDYVDRARDELRAESAVDGSGYNPLPSLPLPLVGESTSTALEVVPVAQR